MKNREGNELLTRFLWKKKKLDNLKVKDGKSCINGQGSETIFRAGES